MESKSNRTRKSLSKSITFICLFSTLTQTAEAQSPVVAGIEHIGINVPDIRTGLQFFTEVLGFTQVTEIGPFALDEAWKKKYKIRNDAELNKIVALRAGNGANIELFEFNSPKRNMDQPYEDDISWHHIAFYTDDINASVAYLKSKGVKVLGDINVSTEGPTAGESWVYFSSPWGSQFELVSYPQGKEYEKNNHQIKLWSPKTKAQKIAASGSNLQPYQVNNLLEKHLKLWGEKDVAKRNPIMTEIYTENVTIVDPFFVLSGTAGLNNFIDDLQKRNAGYSFSLARPIESHNNIARLFWQFGPKSNPKKITGQDVFVIENGKINSLYIFIDGLKK